MVTRFLVFVGIALALLLRMTLYGNDSTESTSSYAAQNLEALKVAQPNDLVVCLEKAGKQSAYDRIVLVNSNSGDALIGNEINKRILFLLGKHPYDVFDHCQVKLIHDTPQNIRTIVGGIILDGYKPPAN